MTTNRSARITIVGASGYFGRLLVQELLAGTDANLILAGRNRPTLEAVFDHYSDSPESNRLRIQITDLRDELCCQTAVEGADIVVCAAGPYQRMKTTLALQC